MLTLLPFFILSYVNKKKFVSYQDAQARILAVTAGMRVFFSAAARIVFARPARPFRLGVRRTDMLHKFIIRIKTLATDRTVLQNPEFLHDATIKLKWN